MTEHNPRRPRRRPRTFHRTFHLAPLSLVIGMCLTAALYGQEEETPAQTDALNDIADGENLKVVISGVQGIVQVRPDEQAAWVKAEKNMELGPGAEFRTGPRSAVRLVIPPDQIITLDRLGTVKVITAIKMAGNKVKTDIGMKYGRTRYDIQKAGIEHESRIYSPSATLAVRGSMVGIEDTALGTNAWSLQDRITIQPKDKPHAIALGGTRTVEYDAELDSVAATATSASVVDPGGEFAGRTEVEAEIIESFNTVAGAGDAAEEGRDIVTQQDFEQQFGGGKLAAFLDWTGMGDLDVFLIDPSGQAVSTFPGAVQGAVTKANGAVASTDHVGSGDEQAQMLNMCAMNQDSCEFIRYNNGFPTGDFVFGAVPFEIENGPVNFKLRVEQNDNVIATLSDSLNAGDPPSTIQVTVQAQGRTERQRHRDALRFTQRG